MDKLRRIKELTNKLHKASIAYYKYDNPIYTDKQYDDMYDELEQLEKETGIVLLGSPTKKVQGFLLKGLEKQKHSKPMLSADKTKDPKEIERFVGNKDFYCSYKLDGLTLVLVFEDGELKSAITRGNGDEGEVVTEAAKMISNIPKRISYKDRLELRGECLVSWSSFNYINEKLEIPFSHPRNMAAGSIRNFDTNIARDRMLEFVVFECVTDIGIDSKLDVLNELDKLGFTTVPRCVNNVEDCIEAMQPEFFDYPFDGLIFEINSRKLSESLGANTKFECCRMALKWKDETYETVFREIEWNTTRTGVINPTAIFDTINIQGSNISRATLHNLSYIEELQLGEGDTIEVYKSNMIIPKVHDNLTRSNTWTYPRYCPCCNYPTEIHSVNRSKTLHCTNPDCSAKLISKLTNFVSKNGMNIVGLSESTLEILVDKKYINSFIDIYNLNRYKAELSNIPGFGDKSIDKLLKSIDGSRNVDLTHLLTAIGINLIGKANAKLISEYCHGSVDEFVFIMNNTSLELTSVDGIGIAAVTSLNDWWTENSDMFHSLLEELNIKVPEDKKENILSVNLSDKTFVITGSLNHFNNRDELKELLESMGAKVSGSVSKNTFALICNDKDSNTGKSKKAKDLGINVLSEDELLEYLSIKM